MSLRKAIQRKFKLIWLKYKYKNLVIGQNVVIDPNVSIICKQSKIVLGNNVLLRGESKGYQAGMPFPTALLLDVPNSEITIGNNCRINGAYIHAQKSIIIGENCVIASGVNILDSNGHNLYSKDRTIGRDKAEQIIIGDNVWIGLNAIILKGTVIGNNSVVSAGSVVKGHFSENSLLVGNPAQLVKRLDIQ